MPWPAVLDRQHRLTRPADFSAAIRHGRRAGSRLLVLHLGTRSLVGVRPDVPGGAGREPLVGFVVSKAVGNAVVRNRVTRRCRHLALERLPELPPDALLVLRALPGAAGATYHALGRDFDVALRRLGQPAPASAATEPPRTGVSR